MSNLDYTQPRNDNFYTTNFRKMGSNSNNYSFIIYGNGIEYIYEGITGKISSVQSPGMVPFYRYYNNNNTKPDHFYTINSGTYTDYSFENIEGMLAKSTVRDDSSTDIIVLQRKNIIIQLILMMQEMVIALIIMKVLNATYIPTKFICFDGRANC